MVSFRGENASPEQCAQQPSVGRLYNNRRRILAARPEFVNVPGGHNRLRHLQNNLSAAPNDFKRIDANSVQVLHEQNQPAPSSQNICCRFHLTNFRAWLILSHIWFLFRHGRICLWHDTYWVVDCQSASARGNRLFVQYSLPFSASADPPVAESEGLWKN